MERESTNPVDVLDETNSRIAELVAAGFTNQEIASRLHLAHQTVRNRITRIFDAVGVNNRTQLAVLWLSAAGSVPAEQSPGDEFRSRIVA